MSKAHFFAGLTLVVALTVTAPGTAKAEAWQHLCRGLGELAERLTDYRNHGRDLQEAVAAKFPELRMMPDRVVAAEVARQVYATPGLNREQEAAAIYTKCVTPAESEALSERQSTIRITDLVAISLQLGPNHIARFAADGRDANITLAWRDEGGGRGQDVFLVTMPSKDGTGWQAVNILQGSASAWGDALTDEPHHGDDMLRSLRFARGRVNSQDTTLLLIVSRVESHGSMPSAAVYEIYRLVQNNGRDGFERIVQQMLPDRYCNADMALSAASGLPLRSSYRGPLNSGGDFTKDGCQDPGPRNARSAAIPARGLNSSAAGAPLLSKKEQEKLFQQFSDSDAGKAHR